MGWLLGPSPDPDRGPPVSDLCSSWTGYMLIKVWHDLLDVGFVKVPHDDKGSVRMFVNVASEHIVKLRQSQAGVCLWWNVNGSNNDR